MGPEVKNRHDGAPKGERPAQGAHTPQGVSCKCAFRRSVPLAQAGAISGGQHEKNSALRGDTFYCPGGSHDSSQHHSPQHRHYR
jgi:hypothetical protein